MKQRSLTNDSRTGRYYVRIQVNGVLKKFYFSTNRRTAEAELRQLEADLENGTRSFAAMANSNVDKSDTKDINIEELITRYLQWYESNREKGTYLNKKGYLQPFLDRYGDCMVSDITYSTFAKYYAWAKKYRGRSANGDNHHLREVKTLFLWGEDSDVCIWPVRRFPAIQEVPAQTKKFTDEELPLLLKHALPDFRDMILFGLLTGLRPPELRLLKRIDIRFIGDRTCIVMEKHKTIMSARMPQPRVVPLSPQAVDIVQQQTQKHPQPQFVFLNDHGTPYKAGTFRQRLKRVCDRAGIPRRSPDALRHYFGTKRAGEGLNLAILAQVMGHGTVVTTMRYVAKVPTYQQQAMDAMVSDLATLLDQQKTEPEPEEQKPVMEFPRLRVAGG